jgi:hypothetical protein
MSPTPKGLTDEIDSIVMLARAGALFRGKEQPHVTDERQIRLPERPNSTQHIRPGSFEFQSAKSPGTR